MAAKKKAKKKATKKKATKNKSFLYIASRSGARRGPGMPPAYLLR